MKKDLWIIKSSIASHWLARDFVVHSVSDTIPKENIMPQKAPMKKSSTGKGMQVYQVQNTKAQQSKPGSTNNQRVLILSTPIKLKDGTINLEQRAIPLRISNNQLLNTGSKNSVISLKRSNEPPPLALPINQLSKKSPTFVKNEIGQVMVATKASPSTSTPPVAQTVKCKFSKQNSKVKNQNPIEAPLQSKETLLNVDTYETSLIQNEEEKPLSSSSTSATTNNSTVNCSKTVQVSGMKQFTTFTSKPKKEIHLVLRGENNMASIGQTGQNIKLIPLDQWKFDEKLNFMRSTKNIEEQSDILKTGMTSKSHSHDEVQDKDDTSSIDLKLHCPVKEEKFSINDLLEKDPLNIENFNIEDGIKKNFKSLSTTCSKEEDDVFLNPPDNTSNYINPSDISSVHRSTSTFDRKEVAKLKSNQFSIETDWFKEKLASLKHEAVTVNYDDVGKNQELETWESEQTDNDSKKIDTSPCKNVYERFNINKSNATDREIAMMSYIQNLRKRLFYLKNKKIHMPSFLEYTQHRNMAYVTGVQRGFIKAQLKNCGKPVHKQRFTKLEKSAAQEILKATGPRGYDNLRKFFYLPTRNVMTNT
ncbi:uncharacterized protein LOC107274967 isoform X2 [Cephus cinctus]|uniref:Uncharacterized protein LOC107274967 isoform X2 n=1 Tax=Cephus cinctus TaxID=211228 RepID=A0AAJ7CG70_CEPCN|nr:uncharacterized protein LOC107274967 isoform X2 [Cephus cinctus]